MLTLAPEKTCQSWCRCKFGGSPEKTITLKTSLLRVYGCVESCAADVNPKVLPDCGNCFAKLLQSVSSSDLM